MTWDGDGVLGPFVPLRSVRFNDGIMDAGDLLSFAQGNIVSLLLL